MPPERGRWVDVETAGRTRALGAASAINGAVAVGLGVATGVGLGVAGGVAAGAVLAVVELLLGIGDVVGGKSAIAPA
jgi:hypothetical protein